jgi:hypothetical protein
MFEEFPAIDRWIAGALLVDLATVLKVLLAVKPGVPLNCSALMEFELETPDSGGSAGFPIISHSGTRTSMLRMTIAL